jgi:hypothetical protein
MVIPVADLISTAWPIQAGTLRWRYGFLGLLANVLLTPMLGAMLASLAAHQLRHLGLLRGVSGLYLAAVLLLGGALVVFVLDAMQLRPDIAAQQITNYRAGAAIASGKYVLGMVGLAWLGVAGFGAAAAVRADEGRRRSTAAVVGGPVD